MDLTSEFALFQSALTLAFSEEHISTLADKNGSAFQILDHVVHKVTKGVHKNNSYEKQETIKLQLTAVIAGLSSEVQIDNNGTSESSDVNGNSQINSDKSNGVGEPTNEPANVETQSEHNKKLNGADYLESVIWNLPRLSHAQMFCIINHFKWAKYFVQVLPYIHTEHLHDTITTYMTSLVQLTPTTAECVQDVLYFIFFDYNTSSFYSSSTQLEVLKVLLNNTDSNTLDPLTQTMVLMIHANLALRSLGKSGVSFQPKLAMKNQQKLPKGKIYSKQTVPSWLKGEDTIERTLCTHEDFTHQYHARGKCIIDKWCKHGFDIQGVHSILYNVLSGEVELGLIMNNSSVVPDMSSMDGNAMATGRNKEEELTNGLGRASDINNISCDDCSTNLTCANTNESSHSNKFDAFDSLLCDNYVNILSKSEVYETCTIFGYCVTSTENPEKEISKLKFLYSLVCILKHLNSTLQEATHNISNDSVGESRNAKAIIQLSKLLSCYAKGAQKRVENITQTSAEVLLQQLWFRIWEKDYGCLSAVEEFTNHVSLEILQDQRWMNLLNQSLHMFASASYFYRFVLTLDPSNSFSKSVYIVLLKMLHLMSAVDINTAFQLLYQKFGNNMPMAHFEADFRGKLIHTFNRSLNADVSVNKLVQDVGLLAMLNPVESVSKLVTDAVENSGQTNIVAQVMSNFPSLGKVKQNPEDNHSIICQKLLQFATSPSLQENKEVNLLTLILELQNINQVHNKAVVAPSEMLQVMCFPYMHMYNETRDNISTIPITRTLKILNVCLSVYKNYQFAYDSQSSHTAALLVMLCMVVDNSNSILKTKVTDNVNTIDDNGSLKNSDVVAVKERAVSCLMLMLEVLRMTGLNGRNMVEFDDNTRRWVLTKIRACDWTTMLYVYPVLDGQSMYNTYISNLPETVQFILQKCKGTTNLLDTILMCRTTDDFHSRVIEYISDHQLIATYAETIAVLSQVLPSCVPKEWHRITKLICILIERSYVEVPSTTAGELSTAKSRPLEHITNVCQTLCDAICMWATRGVNVQYQCLHVVRCYVSVVKDFCIKELSITAKNEDGIAVLCQVFTQVNEVMSTLNSNPCQQHLNILQLDLVSCICDWLPNKQSMSDVVNNWYRVLRTEINLLDDCDAKEFMIKKFASVGFFG